MPLYNFKCPDCGFDHRVLRRPENASVPVPCPECNRNMVRNAQGPTSKVTEVLDNGIMTRKVERLADIEQIVKDRSKIKEDRDP